MGRTVINETENKQTVILNDSPEGVEGGYFDSEMEWHELGGGGGDTFTPLKMRIGKGFSGSSITVNPYRALSYPIKVSKDKPLMLSFPPEIVGVIKPCDANGENIGETITAFPHALIGKTILNTDMYYRNNSLSVSACVLGSHTIGSPYTMYQLSTYPDYIMISWKYGDAGEREISASDVYGYIYADDVWYKLEAEE